MVGPGFMNCLHCPQPLSCGNFSPFCSITPSGVVSQRSNKVGFINTVCLIMYVFFYFLLGRVGADCVFATAV